MLHIMVMVFNIYITINSVIVIQILAVYTNVRITLIIEDTIWLSYNLINYNHVIKQLMFPSP